MRINKYPFLLWLTQEREDFKLDFKNKTIESEELGKSKIKEVPLYLIILLKYLPILLLLPLLYYPKNTSDVLPLIGALITVSFLVFIYIKFENLLKIFTIFIVALNVVLMILIKDYVVALDIGITFFAELGIFAILYLDIFVFKGYKNWYFLENFKNEVNIKVAQKRERKFFFFKKNVGFNVKRKVYIKGYFLRISNEDIK